MPFIGDTFTHLFDWEKDPQRQEKIVNARLEAEFDGIDTGLSGAAARLTAVEAQVGAGLANDSVTNAKLANMVATRVKARGTASTGDPEDIAIGIGLDLDATSLRTKQQMSVTADGSGLKLAGDETSPGNNEYYGTNASGTKGFHPFSRVLLATLTASSSAALSYAGGFSGFHELEIVFENVLPATNAVQFRLRVRSGGSFQTTSYLCSGARPDIGGNVAYSSTTFIALTGSTNLSNSGAGLSGAARGYNVSSSSVAKIFTVLTHHVASGNSPANVVGGGFWNSTAAIDGLEFSMSSGNIASGTIKIYGLT
jgi:hypothetical protein